MQKFVFVTGGVCSSLGKGITSASIAMLLKSAGYRVSIQKLDPYLNVDPGTMSPFQHGEVFVTEDGAETDLDLGHYERFIDENLSKFSTVTTGKIYSEVLQKERKGDFLGGTIQVVPHITDALKEKVFLAAEKSGAEILIAEIGGTVGDIEGEPFLEVVRQMKADLGSENVLSVHLTLLPFLKASGELKTKPTQLSVRELRRVAIQPDILVCRADAHIPEEILEKISRFCGVPLDSVFPAETVSSIYAVPLGFEKRNMAEILQKKLALSIKKPNLHEWETMVDKILKTEKKLTIALVGKYTDLDDAYLSVIESLSSAGFANGVRVQVKWINSEKLEDRDEIEWENLKKCAGICVPGGFGGRGIEGKILAAQYCRENNIPYLGLCLGSQIMAIEFARNVCGLSGANSQEFDESSPHQIVHFLPNQHQKVSKGGTLRLGAYPCVLKKDTKAFAMYQTAEITERHRHRYEFNNVYRDEMEAKGLTFSGTSPDSELMEMVEITSHPFFVGCQFHPEFKSRPHRPHPLFLGFIKASV
ncbi:MAG: CTP synthase [Candidatus Peregrinibacteria bacterium]